MRLIRSTFVISAFTLGSRVLGFAREMLLAAVLGAGPINDIFVIAFRFPNLFRRIFAEGAFNAAFVPLYARRMEAEGEEAADRFASETLSFLFLALGLLTVAMVVAMPLIARALGPGYAGRPELFDLLVLYAQITTPYLLFMSLTAMFGGILNARDRFAAAAAAPIFLNIILVAVLWLAPGESQAETGLRLSVGVAVAGAVQVALVLWGCLRQNARIRLQRPRLTPGVKRLVVLGVPGAISAGITQINIWISTAIASLQVGAASWLYYADRLYQLPLGVVGIAMGVALLPSLSKSLRAGDSDAANQTMNRGAEIALALTLPAAAALIVIPDFLVQGLFERGAFGAEDARNVAIATLIFALALPAFVLIKVFSPGFFAREDTATPMRYAFASMVVNIVVGVALFFSGLGFVGLAIGAALAGWLNALLLFWRLVKDRIFTPDSRLVSRAPRLLIAAAAMGAAVWFAARRAAPMLEGGIAADLAATLGVSALGGVVYLAAAFAIRAVTPGDLRLVLRRR